MGKNKTTPNPDRPRSKNSPDGKGNGTRTGKTTCNEGRRPKGWHYTKWFPKAAYRARNIMYMPQGEYGRRVSAILASIVKSEDGPSCEGTDQTL